MYSKRRIPPVLVLICCMFLFSFTPDTCLAGKWNETAGNREVAHGKPLSRMVCDTLYFGMSGPSGEVTEEQWTEFLKTSVAKRFPAGFTTYDSHGYWCEKVGQMLSERSKVLQIVHGGGAKNEKAFREIIAEYKLKFSQQSVLRVRSSVRASF